MATSGSTAPDLAALNRASLLELTVTGRRTGRPRTVTVWFVATADRLYVTSGRGADSQWIKNVRHTPAVGCRIGTTRLRGPAVYLEGARVRDEIFPLFFHKYFLARVMRWFGWYKEAFAVEITPDADGA